MLTLENSNNVSIVSIGMQVSYLNAFIIKVVDTVEDERLKSLAAVRQGHVRTRSQLKPGINRSSLG